MFRRLLITLTGIIIATPCFAACPICIDITDIVCMSQKQACEASEANEEAMKLNQELLQQQMMQQQQDLMRQQQMMGSQF